MTCKIDQREYTDKSSVKIYNKTKFILPFLLTSYNNSLIHRSPRPYIYHNQLIGGIFSLFSLTNFETIDEYEFVCTQLTIHINPVASSGNGKSKTTHCR